MAEKELKVKISTETDIRDLDDLESKLQDLQETKLQMKLEADTVELEEVETRIEELEQKRADIYMGVDDSDLEEVEAELAELEAKQIDLEIAVAKDEIDLAKSSMDELADSADNAVSSTETLGNSLGLLDASAALSISEAFGSYSGQAEQMAQDMNQAAISVGQLATNVGMAEPQMVSLINNISNATFPQEEALAYVNALNQMGVSAGQLGDAATNMDKINDATHIGYQKTMELTQGLRAVGVEANNLPSSFNAIAYAQANVNGGAGTLSQVLKTQAATINEYGLNVDQLVLIMQKLSEQGVQGKRMGAELSKVLKEANGDTQALEQSLGLQAGTLSNASSETGKYAGQLQNLANEEAEHKTWIDQLNAAWEDLQLSLSPVLSPLMSFVGLIGQFGQFALAVNSINTLVSSIRGMEIVKGLGTNFKSLKSFILDAGNSAKTAAISIGTTLKNALIGAGNAAKGAITSIAEMGKAVLTAGYNALKAAGMWLYEKAQVAASAIAKAAAAIPTYALAVAEWFLASPILIVVVAIVALIAILWYLYNTNETVRKSIDDFIGSLTNIAQTIYGSIKGALDWLYDMLTRLASGDWTVTLNIVQAGAVNVADAGLDMANNDVSRGIVSSILGPDALAQVDEAMPAFQEKLTSSINDMLDSIWENGTWGFLDWLTNLSGIDVGSYLSGMQASFASIPEWVNQAGQGAIQGFQGMFAGISGWLNSIISNVINFGSRLVSNISSAAYRAWQGFVNSIKGMWKHMAEEVDEILSQADRLLRELPGKLWNAAVKMVQGWLTGSGEGSPGFMYYAFEEDLGAMHDIAKNNKLANIMGNTASNMVDAWGNPSFDYILDNSGELEVKGDKSNSDILGLLTRILEAIISQKSTGNVTFNHYGDTDDEDKMYRILDFIQREVDWNNDTAGRNTGV